MAEQGRPFIGGTDYIFNEEELKNVFLEQEIDMDSTKETYRTLFRKTAIKEQKINKDLCQFNKLELDDLLYLLDRGEIGTLMTDVTKMRNYMRWAIGNGNRKDHHNVCNDYDAEKLEKFISPIAKDRQYISSRELKALCGFCENAQDFVCFILPFLGLRGKELSEIRFLKERDVDFDNNLIRVVNHETGELLRTIKDIPEWCMEAIEDALKEETYSISNAEPDEQSIRKENTIVENEYVVRHVALRATKDAEGNIIISREERAKQAVDRQNINSRISKILRIWSAKKDQLNTRTLYYSGMIEETKKIEQTGREIDHNVFRDVVEKFGMRRNSYAKLRNTWKALKDQNLV